MALATAILDSGRIDELDRWMPMPVDDLRWHPEWQCLAACRLATEVKPTRASAVLAAAKGAIESRPSPGSPSRALLERAEAFVNGVR